MKRVLNILVILFVLLCAFGCTKKPLDNAEANGTELPIASTTPTEEPTQATTEAPTEEPLPEVECYFISGVNEVTALDFNLPKWSITEWSKMWESEEAPEEFSVVINGKEYVGTYQDTTYGYYRSSPIHTYYFDNAGMDSPFSIDASSLELIHIGFSNRSFITEESMLPDLEGIEETAESIARGYALILIDNLEDYEMIGPEITDAASRYENVASFNKYVFEFVRTLNGEKTTDYLEVHIDSKGNLLRLSSHELGVYDRLAEEGAKFEGIDLVAYMRPIFDEAYKGNTSDPEIRNVLYALTPDNEVVLMFEAYITLSDGMAAGGSFMLK